MSEECKHGHDDSGNLPKRVRRNNDLDVSGPGRPGIRSYSSDESRRRIADLENSIEEVKEIADQGKRDDVLVARHMGAIRMSNMVAVVMAVGYCVCTFYGKPFPIPPEFILLIATPYGMLTALKLLNKLKGRINGK